MAHLLLIDDDPALIPRQVRQAFPSPLHRVEVANSGKSGLERLRNEAPDVILLDLRLPDQPGLEVYRAIREIDARIPVIFITVTRSADAAIEAMHRGAFDYLFKPFDIRRLQSVVAKAVEVARQTRAPGTCVEEAPGRDGEGGLIGTCTAMSEVYKAIGRVTGQNVPVLITGESGTGKELVAQAILKHGPRAQGPFLTLNCAAIPEALLESELFGHEKGAFTGADRLRIGKFEQCDGGTIFLDEIGDMPLTLQAKILRLLQDQVFERVGGNETLRTDVRLIAATHRNLKALSAEGKFRSDLYYRLSVFTVHLPPLRQRGDDLLLLVPHFVRLFNLELGREIREVATETLDRLRRYTWPGNIRELQSVLKQALLQAAGPVLLPIFLPAEMDEGSPTDAWGTGAQPRPLRPRTSLSDLEHEAIQQCLFQTGGNRQRTADLLGISTRTLLRKIREYRLDDPLRPPASAGAEPGPLA